jgi:hypothetical protein
VENNNQLIAGKDATNMYGHSQMLELPNGKITQHLLWERDQPTLKKLYNYFLKVSSDEKTKSQTEKYSN